jgi:hypothetical protein
MKHPHLHLSSPARPHVTEPVHLPGVAMVAAAPPCRAVVRTAVQPVQELLRKDISIGTMSGPITVA